MTERGPLPYPAPEPDERRWDMSHLADREVDWGRSQIGEVLDAVPGHTHDVAWGDGNRYEIGHDPETASRLEIFPAAGVVRLTSQDAQLTLFRQPAPSLSSDRVRFEQLGPDSQLQLTLTRHGRARLDIIPIAPEPTVWDGAEPHRTPTLPPEPADAIVDTDASETPLPHQARPIKNAANRPVVADTSTEIAPGTETRLCDDSGGPEGPVPTPVRASEVAPDTVETQAARLSLGGRLGRAPSFRTTRSGRLIATFPLAVRDEAGNTTWHTVLAFDGRAEQLRDQVAKGQYVEVIGYRHQRERTIKSGETRLIEEIYATVVKLR